MATQIGAQRSLAKVDRAALLDEARAMGMTVSISWPKDCIERLESGQPLAEPVAKSAKRLARAADHPTLDAATAAKQTMR
jgi:hypothetical protein